MPQGATPQTHIAAGAWCFVGRDALFPGWDSAGVQAHFPLPPDPFADAGAFLAAARAANGEVLRLARRYSGDSGLSESYRLLAAGPYILLAVHMLAERQQRALDLVRLYGDTPLRVPLQPADIPFSFAGTKDFMVHGVLDAAFNHFVYSRIIEAIAPPAWRLEYLPPARLHRAEAQPAPPLRARATEAVRALLRALPFPRIKGFTLRQSLVLSLAVLLNKKKLPDASLAFSLYCDAPLVWRFPAESLINACMPPALAQARHPAPSSPATKTTPGPLCAMLPVFSQDDRYRLRLARKVERGARLFCVQHGANYGNLKSVGILPFEYARHAFFSWGWQHEHAVPANALPMPNPLLAGIAGTHRETAPRLVLVSTEMSGFSYRLKSRPQSGVLPVYRHGKRRFLSAVREKIAETGGSVLYRPYFPAPGGLEDGSYIQRELPGIPLCTGDLTTQILGCRLLALDHYGTTLHTALAANVPLLAFWNRQHWGMDAASDKALDLLAQAGILHETPEAAAAHALDVWDHVQAWWKSGDVRNARAFWMEHYARVGDTPESPWSAATLTRRWFAALREL